MAYSSIEAWPADSTKRSRSGHAGSAGLWRRWRVKSTYARGASPIGAPGCPELACSTASIDSARMVVTASVSTSLNRTLLDGPARAGPAKRAGPSEATRTGGGVTRPYTPAEASCQRPREPEAVPASLRTSPAFVRLTTVTAALTVVLVALGGAVRAFDAGLACPTWPGCFTAGDFVPPAVVTVWLEHTHRLVAGAVGLLLAAAFFWVLARYRRQRDLLWLSAAAAFIVVLQALLGALVVWQQLQAELVTAHLGLGTALLALELVLATRARHVPAAPLPAAQVRLARQGIVVAGLVWVQLLVGAHVTGVGSGLAFVDQAALGMAAVGPIGGEAEAFNVLHRALAVVVAAATMWLVAKARRARVGGWALRLPRLAAWLVVVQIVLGVVNLATDLAPQVVVLHLAVASWIWAVLVGFVLAVPRTDWPGGDAPTPQPHADALEVAA